MVHPGQYRDNPEVAWQQFLENLERLNAICKQRQIELAVETMYVSSKESRQRYFLDDLESIQALRSAILDLKWVLDLSHLNIGWNDRIEERLKVIDCIADQLSKIHISDDDGQRDLNSWITDETWWIPWLDRLPTGIPIVLETRLNHLPAPAIRAEYERVRSLFS